MTEAGSAAEPRVGFVALMRNRDYALLWSGQLVSKLGDWIHLVALLWWVQSQTGSTLATSAVVGAAIVGTLAGSPVGGALADRLSRKPLLVAADLIRAILVVLIPFAVPVHLGLVVVLVFLIKVASALFDTSLLASIPQIVDRRSLHAANVYYASMDNLIDIAGTLTGGAVLALVGPAVAFYVDATTYLASAATVAMIALPAAAGRAALSAGAVLGDIAAGARYVRRHAGLWSALLVIAAMSAMMALDPLLTSLALRTFRVGEQLYSALLAAAPLGAFVGSLALPALHRVPRLRIAAGATIAKALLLVALALAPDLFAALVIVFLIGVTTIAWVVSARTAIMEQAPPEVLGRSFAFVRVVGSFAHLLAQVGYGRLADVAGVRVSLAAEGGVGFALIAAVLVAIRSRAVDARAIARRLVTGQVSDQFDPGQQRVLNVVLAAVAALLWLRLVVQWPVYGAGVAAVVAAGYVAARLARGAR